MGGQQMRARGPGQGRQSGCPVAWWGKALPPSSVSGSDLSPQTNSVSGYFPNMLTPKRPLQKSVLPSGKLSWVPTGKGGPTGGPSEWAGGTDGPRLHGQQLPQLPQGPLWIRLALVPSYVCVRMCARVYTRDMRILRWSLCRDGAGDG